MFYCSLFCLVVCLRIYVIWVFVLTSLTFPSGFPAVLPESQSAEHHVGATWIRWQIICSGITPFAKRHFIPGQVWASSPALWAHQEPGDSWPEGNVCSKSWERGSPSLTDEVFGHFTTGTFHSKENFAGNISDRLIPCRIQAVFPWLSVLINVSRKHIIGVL